MFAGLMLLGLLGQGLVAPFQSAYPVTELEVHTLGLVLSLPLQLIVLATVTRFFPPYLCPIGFLTRGHPSGVRRFLPGVVGGGGGGHGISSLMRQVCRLGTVRSRGSCVSGDVD